MSSSTPTRTARRIFSGSALTAATAATALSIGMLGVGSGSAAAVPSDGPAWGAEALSITVPQGITVPLAPGSAPANPTRAVALVNSVADYQAASAQVIAKAQAKAKAEQKKKQEEKAAKAAASARGSQQASRSAARPSGSPRAIGQQMASARGWGGAQFTCLEKLWTKESNWTPTAANPTSSAYGIPQPLPGSKMASHGSDWRTNPATQIAWGLDYIADRYGSPCSAWAHSQRNNWY